MRRITPLLIVALTTALGCTEPLPAPPSSVSEVHTDLTHLKDAHGRYVNVHGVNLGGSTKTPFTAPYDEDPEQLYFTDLDFTYVNRPFPIDEADHWFSVINDLGFNAVRFILNWEGIEPHARGEYDEEYLDFIDQMVAKAGEHDIYVLMDMHQDMFSRHLYTRFNEYPYETLRDNGYDDTDAIAANILAMLPPYTDTRRGDGAPRWAVEAALPHKDLDSPFYGEPHIWGPVAEDPLTFLDAVGAIVDVLAADTGEPAEFPWVTYLLEELPDEPYTMDQTTNMLPWSMWGINNGTSLDQEMVWAAFFAGRDCFPIRETGGQNVQDYLQDGYEGAWRQVAMRVADDEHVIGYDIMNEPNGIYIALTLGALVAQTGVMDGIEGMLIDMLGEELGPDFATVFKGLMLIPPDNEPETLDQWGLADADLMAILGLNMGLDANYTEPFYSKMGQAIQEEDPGAVIWIESTMGLEVVTGGGVGGVMEMNMVHPEGINQLVYAPHWYPDIYPMVGLIQEPRDFTVDEIQHRDYTEGLETAMEKAHWSLGNVPVVYGEFGTYYNFNGIEQSIEEDYEVSAHVLDNYYESFEELFLGHMQWVFTTDNSYEEGDWWNGEDFSVIDPNGDPRGEQAYSRPYARALAGKPVATHFYSPLRYFDPDKGTPNPVGEFFVEYESRESDAPTEIFVPEALHYPDGFYVWISDGRAIYDPDKHLLYHYPGEDAPGVNHTVRLLPPIEGLVNEDWDYFFSGERMVNGR
jgi:hypothetical protein